LVAEILATQDILDRKPLSESMDLSYFELNQLFDRCQKESEKIKNER